MKKLVAILTLALGSAPAFAHPGGHSLTCKTGKNSGSKQVVEFTLNRSNGTGWFPPSYSITINGKKSVITTEDEMKTFGETFHNSPLGVITVTATNLEEKDPAVRAYFSVLAIPSTVKSYNSEGKIQTWSFQAEKDDCNDASGKATFRGIFKGFMSTKGSDSSAEVDTQILDCELDYNSGMAC